MRKKTNKRSGWLIVESGLACSMLKFENIKKMKAFWIKLAKHNQQQQIVNALRYNIFNFLVVSGSILYYGTDVLFWSAR